MRVHRIFWGALLCLSGCGPPIVEADIAPARYAAFVPGPLQPNNCGTPDHYERCPPSPVRRVAVTKVKTFVTIQELGGSPAQEAKIIFPE